MKRDKSNTHIESVFNSLDSVFNTIKTDMEIEKEVLNFFDYQIMKHIGINHRIDYKQIIDRTREVSNRYNKILLILKKTTDSYIKTIENSIRDSQRKDEFQYSYPKFVSPNDPSDSIKFYNKIKKLDKGTGFTIIKGAELIDVSRQTLSKWIKEEKFGLKRKKNNKISIQELYVCHLHILKKNK
jgi:DNA-binding XRE family transcriptional regulator